MDILSVDAVISLSINQRTGCSTYMYIPNHCSSSINGDLSLSIQWLYHFIHKFISIKEHSPQCALSSPTQRKWIWNVQFKFPICLYHTRHRMSKCLRYRVTFTKRLISLQNPWNLTPRKHYHGLTLRFRGFGALL